MPEEPEVDTDQLRDSIQEKLDREGGSLLRQIAFTTAILAALAAFAALKAGDTANEALIAKTEATRLQSAASDKWAHYQAKGIKSAVQEAARSSYLAADKVPPPELVANVQRYMADQSQIEKEAADLEHERNERSEHADHLMHHHHGFANAVALFQVAIALGAIAALTRTQIMWFGSIAVGLLGLSFLVTQLAP